MGRYGRGRGDLVLDESIRLAGVQVKLHARWLQERTFEAVGAHRRIGGMAARVAATNAELSQLVRPGLSWSTFSRIPTS